MRILVTGCAGFIGFHTTKKLLENKKDIIYGIDDLNKYYDINLKKDRLKILKKFKNFIFYRLDISNYKKIYLNFDRNKYQHVLHFAARAGVRFSFEKSLQYVSSNINGFYNVLEAARLIKVKHFMFASTSSIYGEAKSFPTKETDSTSNQESFYAATKKTNEILAKNYSNIYKMKITCMRFFTVYGPFGRPDMALFKFTKSIISSKEVTLYNFGNHYRDFTFIDDTVYMIMQLRKNIPTNKMPYDVFNIASGKTTSLKSFIMYLEKLTNKRLFVRNVTRQKGDVIKTHGNIFKISKKIKLKEMTNIKNGIELFLSWYKEYYSKK